MFEINAPPPPVTIVLRIPGNWPQPRDLEQRLPEGYRLTPEAMILPDGSEVGLSVMRADDQFAEIFRSSCRQPALPEELAVVDAYTVNILLSGPGGSLNADFREAEWHDNWRCLISRKPGILGVSPWGLSPGFGPRCPVALPCPRDARCTPIGVPGLSRLTKYGLFISVGFCALVSRIAETDTDSGREA